MLISDSKSLLGDIPTDYYLLILLLTGFVLSEYLFSALANLINY